MKQRMKESYEEGVENHSGWRVELQICTAGIIVERNTQRTFQSIIFLYIQVHNAKLESGLLDDLVLKCRTGDLGDACTAKPKQGIGGLGIELRKLAIRTPTRFSCMKFLGVSGVYDYAGPSRDSRYRPTSSSLPHISN